MTANNAAMFPQIPEYTPDHPTLLRKVISVVNNALHGKTNNVYDATLTDGATSTVINLPTNELGQNTIVVFFATSATAAVELASGSMWVSARTVTGTTPSFTITHSNVGTGKTFRFALIG